MNNNDMTETMKKDIKDYIYNNIESIGTNLVSTLSGTGRTDKIYGLNGVDTNNGGSGEDILGVMQMQYPTSEIKDMDSAFTRKNFTQLQVNLLVQSMATFDTSHGLNEASIL